MILLHLRSLRPSNRWLLAIPVAMLALAFLGAGASGNGELPAPGNSNRNASVAGSPANNNAGQNRPSPLTRADAGASGQALVLAATSGETLLVTLSFQGNDTEGPPEFVTAWFVNASTGVTNPSIQVRPADGPGSGAAKPATAAAAPDTPPGPDAPADSAPRKDVFRLPLHVEVGSDSGEFSGVVLVRSASGVVSVPVIVRVKHHWPLPVVTLLVSAAIGLIITTYQARGKRRDQLLVRRGRVTESRALITEPSNPFRNAVDARLLEFDQNLLTGNLDAAESALTAAEVLVLRWRSAVEAWTKQLEFAQTLRQQVESEQPANFAYLRALVTEIESAVFAAPEAASPQAFAVSLRGAFEKFVVFRNVRRTLGDYSSLCQQHPGSDCTANVAVFETELQAVTTEAELGNLRERIVAAKASLGGAAPPGLALESPASTLEPPPPGPAGSATDSHRARLRLEAFLWLCVAVALLLLVAVGYTELYETIATFGASASDYLRLMVWGLGAEFARSSILTRARELALGAS